MSEPGTLASMVEAANELARRHPERIGSYWRQKTGTDGCAPFVFTICGLFGVRLVEGGDRAYRFGHWVDVEHEELKDLVAREDGPIAIGSRVEVECNVSAVEAPGWYAGTVIAWEDGPEHLRVGTRGRVLVRLDRPPADWPAKHERCVSALVALLRVSASATPATSSSISEALAAPSPGPCPRCGVQRRERGETRTLLWRCGCAIAPYVVTRTAIRRDEATGDWRYSDDGELGRNPGPFELVWEALDREAAEAELREKRRSAGVRAVHPTREGAIALWRDRLGEAQRVEDAIDPKERS